MALGDGTEAVAAGFSVPDGAIVLASDIDWWLTYVLDLIATRTELVLPVAQGGTGSTTPLAAREALDIDSTTVIRPGSDSVETTLISLGSRVTALESA